jgi:hypothetical protein
MGSRHGVKSALSGTLLVFTFLVSGEVRAADPGSSPESGDIATVESSGRLDRRSLRFARRPGASASGNSASPAGPIETTTGVYLIRETVPVSVDEAGGDDPNLVNRDEVDRSQVEVIHVKAEIDGRSRLVFQGNTVRWEHYDFGLPGLWGPEEDPTVINGVEWLPLWESLHRRKPIRSDVLQLPTFLAPESATFSVQVLQGPGTVTIHEQPSSGNGYSLVVEFYDRKHEGLHEYSVQLLDTAGDPAYEVTAGIDGRRHLVLAGNTARWRLFDCIPGQSLIETRPTMVNESIWYPKWSEKDYEESCGSRTKVFPWLSPPLPARPLDVTVGIIQARGAVRVIEEPSEENDYTLIVEFDDNPLGGAVPYEIEIYYPK